MSPYEITPDDIGRLNAHQLTEVLRIFVGDEARRYGIFHQNVHVSWNITVADGGSDGEIRWEAAPAATNWLPKNDVLFPSGDARQHETRGGLDLLAVVPADHDRESYRRMVEYGTRFTDLWDPPRPVLRGPPL